MNDRNINSNLTHKLVKYAVHLYLDSTELN